MQGKIDDPEIKSLGIHAKLRCTIPVGGSALKIAVFLLIVLFSAVASSVRAASSDDFDNMPLSFCVSNEPLAGDLCRGYVAGPAKHLLKLCTSDSEIAVTLCETYLRGYLDGIAMSGGDGLAHFGSKLCLPAGLTGNQVKDIFIQGMRRGRSYLDNRSPASALGVVLWSEFSCSDFQKQMVVPSRK